jgi:hypothetical protein
MDNHLDAKDMTRLCMSCKTFMGYLHGSEKLYRKNVKPKVERLCESVWLSRLNVSLLDRIECPESKERLNYLPFFTDSPLALLCLMKELCRFFNDERLDRDIRHRFEENADQHEIYYVNEDEFFAFQKYRCNETHREMILFLYRTLNPKGYLNHLTYDIKLEGDARDDTELDRTRFIFDTILNFIQLKKVLFPL